MKTGQFPDQNKGHVPIDEHYVDALFKDFDDTVIDTEGNTFNINLGSTFYKKGNFSTFDKVSGFHLLAINTETIGALTDAKGIIAKRISDNKERKAKLLAANIANTKNDWDSNLNILRQLEIRNAIEFSFDSNSTDIMEESKLFNQSMDIILTSNSYQGITLRKAFETISFSKQIELLKIILDMLYFVTSSAKKNIIAKAILTVGLAINVKTTNKLDAKFYNSMKLIEKNCDTVSKFICDKVLGLNT